MAKIMTKAEIELIEATLKALAEQPEIDASGLVGLEGELQEKFDACRRRRRRARKARRSRP